MHTSFSINMILHYYILGVTFIIFPPITKSQKIEELSIKSGEIKPLEGQNVTFICKGVGDEVLWHHKRHAISSNTTKYYLENHPVEDAEDTIESELHVLKLTLKDSGKYRCLFKKEESKVEEIILIHVQAPPRIEETRNFTGQSGSEALLSCTSKAAPSPQATWVKDGTLLASDKYIIKDEAEASLHISKLTIKDVTIGDNGTYLCQFENLHGKANSTTLLLVQDPPGVELTLVKSFGPEELMLEWTVEDNNSPINATEIVIFVGEEEMSVEIDPSTKTSVKLEKDDLILEQDGQVPSAFQVMIRVSNDIGSGESELQNVTMLTKKPIYVPEASLRGSTKDSLSVSWTRPREELGEYIESYKLSLTDIDTGDVINTVKDATQSAYLFENLKHGTMYQFTIEACMKMSEKCSPSSSPVSGKTLAEPPSRVSDVLVHCISNRTTGVNRVYVEWEPSVDESNLDSYKIELKASAHFINEIGRSEYYNNDTYVIVEADARNYTFNNVKPNTNYTVKVYAGSNNVFSSSLMSNCETPFWLPHVRNWRWWKSKSDQRIVLKLLTPKVSQRNGTICCHRVVVVRLGRNKTVGDLPQPKDIPILSYLASQNIPYSSGYVAEAFVSREIKSQYLLVGDGKVTGNWSAECARCIGVEPYASMAREKLSEGVTSEVSDGSEASYASTNSKYMRRRSPEFAPIAVDGHLSQEDNYTGYIIMSVRDKNGTILSSYSDFFNVIQPVDDPIHLTATTPSTLNASLTGVVYILGALIIILLLMALGLGFLLCHYKKKRKQLIEDGADESLSGSLGRIFRTLRRSHTLMSQPGIDVAPIPKDQLVTEYLEKIKDSELGFRREFEALPEKFYDRSSRASEMAENASKNRYPDIKAYDQTRVKLSQVNGIVGSNYINANYVLGYKERKKFICAQGPMESTVNDFWRMIVEQRSSLCIMLTNLEETGKVKCVKYWPEAGEPKTFGNITVRLVKEKLYADYLVRTLRAEWTVSSAAGNGSSSNSGENGAITSGTATTKSNSSTCNSVSNSNYNSLSSNSMSTSEETKCHEVQQYHYLMWKDFVAPEHPVGLLSFLRRINEAYSPDMGPLLVHCSAGVGRTGTLVALDTLVAELDEENQASIFNVICDLRHQRNFLVQSLKQYVFVHRALMEHAQFGNSEQAIPKLKENYARHVQHSGEGQTDLEKEFERLGKVIEDRKAFTVANNEANKNKNRYDFVLPYDTNCVILQPLPSQIGTTYINASFVAGFDLGENFIVTQDPLENTVSDFWRMIYEQEVNTIVMLSELGSGENLCGKYWPDEEECHEYITVKFVTSESYPKYNTRSFTVTNNKNGDSISVTQFQYVGWSGLIGEVPLVTYGIMEVITRVQAHNDANLSNLSNLSSQPPTVVHCSGGGDRSSVYVCLNNCLRQLRRESCVDVFQTARKIRSQRQFQIQEFAQYEFVYKALVEYVDMKRGENL